MFPAAILALAALVLPAAADSASTSDSLAFARYADSIEQELHWQTGRIELPGGKARITLPEGYRYLPPEDAEIVLTRLWSNPSGAGTLGMVFGPGQRPSAEESWGVVVSYDDDGHVDDEDAAEIDYEELLEGMKQSTEESNKAREEAGFGAVHLLGWAEKPHYDAEAKKIYWAKLLEFEGSSSRTLNYYVRVLGREGVLNLNAVSGMGMLPQVRTGMAALQSAAEFTPGNRYADFDKRTDRMSKLGIAALVGGGLGVAAKAGVFKWLLAALFAMKKFVIVGVVAIGGAIGAWWKKSRGEDASA